MRTHLTFSPKGRLTVNLRFPDGTTKNHFEEDNLIVSGGRALILRPLYVTGAVSDPINSLHVGSGGTIDPQGLYPKIPTLGLTSLYHDDISLGIVATVDDPLLPSVTFRGSVGQDVMNGTLISEAGLFTVAGVMFNIKTFSGIPKTENFSVDFEWIISVL